MNKSNNALVLHILKNIQTCIKNKDTFIPGVGDCHNKDENYVSPFNLSLSFSIDWHVYAHTPGDLGINIDFLHPAYLELGYKDVLYPVESTVSPGGDRSTWAKEYDNYNLYFRDNEYSKERAILVDKLVEYYESKL